MGRTGLRSVYLWYLVWAFAISADAVDKNEFNIWPMPISVSYGFGNLHLSNDFELKTEGSKFADASGILKDAFLRSIAVLRSTHVIEVDTSKIDPSLVLKGIHIVVSSPSDEVLIVGESHNCNKRNLEHMISRGVYIRYYRMTVFINILAVTFF